MRTIYVVEGRVDYETHYVLRAFNSEEQAIKFQAACELLRDAGEDFDYAGVDHFYVAEMDFVE